MKKLNVAVIFGGTSSEHDVSITSATTIIKNFPLEKYNVIPIFITKSGIWTVVENTSNLNGIKCVISNKCIIKINENEIYYIDIDIAIPVLHGLFGEDGTVQGIFEVNNIRYVGCNVLSSAICMDKAIMHTLVNTIGIQQVESLFYKKIENTPMSQIYSDIEKSFGYPCFIKPANAGSSIGICKVKEKANLLNAIEEAFKHDKKIIVQRAVNGREIECAVLGDGGSNTKCTNVGEIYYEGEFYDYTEKYTSTKTKVITNPKLDQDIILEVKDLSLKIFKLLDCKGLSRIDFYLENGKVIFNEINTFPGFTDKSMYPKLWEEAGYKIKDIIEQLIEIALN